MIRAPLRLVALAAAMGALLAQVACLYTGDVPPVLPYEEPQPPVIVNELPPRYARVAVGPDGQLFEVWVTDPNTQDQDSLTITWTLEGLTGVLSTGSKLMLRSGDLPEPAAGRTSVLLTVQVRDQDGLEAGDGLEWDLTAEPNLGSL